MVQVWSIRALSHLRCRGLRKNWGDDRSAIAVTPTESYVFQNTILKLASRSEVSLERKSFHSISFGPFEDSSIWPENQQSVILLPAVRNPGTPVEAVNISELEALSDLLGQLIGLPSGRISDSTVESATSVSRKLSHPLPLHANPAVEYNIGRLLEVAGVSGKEQDVRELIKKLLPDRLKKRVYTTKNGNLIVRIGQGAEPSSIFIAHMDEIGYQVKTINPNGWISTVMRGGIIPNLFFWRPVVVHTARGPVQAAMTRPGNLDFGDITSNAFKKLGIKVGDSITAPKRYYKLFGNRISGRSLDNRLGCAVLLEAIHRIAPQANRSTHSVEFVFSVEEEIGLLGAKKLAAIKAPKRVYAVDTFVTSDSPLDEPLIAHAQLGNGPVLRTLDESGLTPRNELIRVLELAKRRKIPIQTGVTAGGNDGAAFGFTDTVNIPIGFPLRYPHSAVETADLADARAAVDLIETLAQAELSGR